MAVKPIPNPFPIELDQINRATQRSEKTTSLKGTISNREQTVIPGTKSGENYQIVLKDLDTAVMTHVKDVMDLRVTENGELVPVGVMYGNMERWANVRKPDGVIRDKNGSLILPLLIFKRSEINFNDTLPSWKHDVTGDFINVTRNSKWSKDNKYTRFAVQTGRKPVEENIITGVPQYVNATYEFIMQTAYITQMNSIVESFVQQHKTYWGDNASFRFLCKVDGSMSDSSEITMGSDRIIKTNFSVTLNGYLLPEVLENIINKKRFNAQKTISVSKINFSEKIE